MVFTPLIFLHGMHWQKNISYLQNQVPYHTSMTNKDINSAWTLHWSMEELLECHLHSLHIV